ncbi:hypothetical protein APSETT444_004726 [Aspergillus pseudonomiae]
MCQLHYFRRTWRLPSPRTVRYIDIHRPSPQLFLAKSTSLPRHLTPTHDAFTILEGKLLSLEECAKPSSLYDRDYPTWQRLHSALFHVIRGTGDADKQKDILLKLVGNAGPGGNDVVALQNLAALYEETGEHDQAERLAKETLPLLQEHRALGLDRPQSLGSLRVLIKALWKQGKVEEAKQVIQEACGSVDRLAEGQFSDFQQEEREALETAVADFEEVNDRLLILCRLALD